jgi:uncharacterized RDD family membrane protein YckC
MNENKETRYAGFWIRLWASFIDSILVLLIVSPVLLMIVGPEILESEQFTRGPVNFLISWGLPAVAVLAFWIYKSATPGKMVISAKIVDAKTGEKPTVGQLVGRYLGYFVSALPLGLGFLWIAFDSRKQGWHDKLAGTVVIRTN